MQANDAPERAHVLIAKIEADSAEDLAIHLENMARRILMGELTTGVSGGYSTGDIYSYKISPEQTHDAWFEQLKEWLERERAGQS